MRAASASSTKARAIASRRAQARIASSMRAARTAARPRKGSEIRSRICARGSSCALSRRLVSCSVAWVAPGLQHRAQQFVAVAEVPVEAAACDLQRPRQHVHAHAVDALVHQHLGGGGDPAFGGQRGAAALGHGLHGRAAWDHAPAVWKIGQTLIRSACSASSIAVQTHTQVYGDNMSGDLFERPAAAGPAARGARGLRRRQFRAAFARAAEALCPLHRRVAGPLGRRPHPRRRPSPNARPMAAGAA